MSRRATASIVASPVLVGAVTMLVIIVAVLPAYNANQGLPFVPTYDVSARLPGGANLVEGNEVRVGGFRVGIISKLRPAVEEETGDSIAVAEMKLDKTIEPLPVDTAVVVRPRSALGLKYIELSLGDSEEVYAPGDTIPLENATRPVEIDEFFSQYSDVTREAQRGALTGFGTAFAGRGQSINRAIEGLVPFVTYLEPVMTNLSDPDTELDEFFKNAGRFSAEIAPVARTYASLFVNMATTFEALSRSPEALRSTIEKSAPTLEAGIQSFPVQRPFLADAERLFAELLPVAVEFDRTLPTVASALEVGRPVLLRAPPFHRRTADVFRALLDLARNPNTLAALRDLTKTLRVAAPLVRYVAPYQTVCNYWNYYWTALGEHLSELIPGGTIERVLLRSDSATQDNRLGDSTAERPVDLPRSQDAQGTQAADGTDLQTLHRGAYEPAIGANGKADCQVGQRGYLDRHITGSRYPVSNTELGGNHIVLDSDLPGLSGPTYVPQRLGIDELRDVP